MAEFLQEINWSPLWISLKTGVVSTVLAFFLGIFCARKAMKLSSGWKAVLDGIFTMPLVAHSRDEAFKFCQDLTHVAVRGHWMRPKDSFMQDGREGIPQYLFLPPEHLMLLKE